MEYLKFSLLFTLAHILAYTIAGAIALGFSKDIYETKDRHATFLRDMSNEEERRHVSRNFLLAQIVRGLLMSLVLFPLLPSIVALPFGLSVAFFSGLMFIYTHLAAVSPFLDNIEGWVYFKEEYLVKKFFLKFQVEMILYSLLFSLLIGFGMRLVM
jgi:hypothetical protein